MTQRARSLALLLLLGGLWAVGGAHVHATTLFSASGTGTLYEDPFGNHGHVMEIVPITTGMTDPTDYSQIGSADSGIEVQDIRYVRIAYTAGHSCPANLRMTYASGTHLTFSGSPTDNGDGTCTYDFGTSGAGITDHMRFVEIGAGSTDVWLSGAAANAGSTFSGWTGSYAAPSGGSAYLVLADSGGFTPDTPDADPIGTTGVVRINSPAFQATTTSPVAVSFDYTLATSSSPSENNLLYNNYRLVFTNQATQATITTFGVLTHDAYGTWNQTDSVSLTGNGTWELTVALATDGTAGGRGYAPRGFHTYFGLGFLDVSGIPPQYLPPQQTSYASSSCAISFAGTFDLPQCLGYLIVPTTGSTSPLRNIQSLTLANTFPFAYIYQLGDIRSALFTSTTTEGSSTIAITVPWFGGGTTQFTFLSNAMLSGVPYAAWIKTILAFLLWLMLAELIYYQVIRAHDENTPHV